MCTSKVFDVAVARSLPVHRFKAGQGDCHKISWVEQTIDPGGELHRRFSLLIQNAPAGVQLYLNLLSESQPQARTIELSILSHGAVLARLNIG